MLNHHHPAEVQMTVGQMVVVQKVQQLMVLVNLVLKCLDDVEYLVGLALEYLVESPPSPQSG